jgi:hypothetical protein
LRILNLEASKRPRGIEIKALLSDTEFGQLLSQLDNLCVFATQTITEPATAIKTGARHSYAKYLLFPVKLRRQFKTDDFDFEKVECGAVKYRDKLYVIYGVPRKDGGFP